MIEYKVKYNGVIYCNLGYFYLAQRTKMPEDLTNLELPHAIDKASRVLEDDLNISLEIGNVFFDIDIAGNYSFYEEFDKKIVFNKKTLRAEGDRFTKEIVARLTESNPIRSNIIRFISKIIDLNENVSEHIKTMPEYIYMQRDETTLLNFYNMVTFNLLEYEKIINSNNIKFLETNISGNSFEITEASKLHQVVGLPKFAINELKELKLEELMEPIRILSEVIDGNSLKIYFNFLNKSKLLYSSNFKKSERIPRLDTFTRNLAIICEKKYKITDLLNYLLRQSMYYNKNHTFSFPIDESMYLKDYIYICEKYDLKYDRYPSQLKKMHDIVSKNVLALEKQSDELEQEFKKAVEKYSKVEREVVISLKKPDGTIFDKSYVFIVPNAIKDIVQEGNDLHHCVGSYSDKIINGDARIVFMRDKNSPKVSMVTIDINEYFDLSEAKKNFNEEVDDDQNKAIKKWIKEIKSL